MLYLFEKKNYQEKIVAGIPTPKRAQRSIWQYCHDDHQGTPKSPCHIQQTVGDSFLNYNFLPNYPGAKCLVTKFKLDPVI